MARKSWGQLSDAYRARLARAGIGQEQHARGVTLSKARGHKSPTHEAKQSFFYRRINRHADRLARYYGQDRDDVKEALRGVSLSDASQAIELQTRMQELYEDGQFEAATSLWESRDRSLPDWMFFYHGAFS